jgi:hypothetical protein
MAIQDQSEAAESALDLPIQVVYGDDALDWGVAGLPKAVLWFYRHLRCDDERLDDREMLPLVLLIALWEDREEPLRLSNLPCATPVSTLEHHYLKKWRRMGLVFTRRVYYTRDEMAAVFGEGNAPSTPRQKARVFDVSSLLYNCLRVAHAWQAERYPAACEAWQEERRACRAAGRSVPRAPHPRFPPPDFTLEIDLPPALAARITGGSYQFVPERWRRRACEIAAAVPVRIVPVQPRTGTNRTGHLESTSLREETLSAGAESGPLNGPPPLSEKISQISSPAAAGTGSPGRLPAGEAATGPAGPAGGPSQGAGRTHAQPAGPRVEPLPERRRRVLDDLRRARDRRKRVAIVTQNIGEILGLGLDSSGVLRTRPAKGDYARVGRMMREYGDEVVWTTACQVAGAAIEGDPLAYLEACLRNRRQRSQRDAPSVSRDGGRRQARTQARRDDYPESPEGYGDGWAV